MPVTSLSNLLQNGQEKKTKFLDVNISLRNRQIETDLHIKPTDTHPFFDSASCHPYHCKKSVPYSQTLRNNRIFLIMKNLINTATT